MNPERQSVLLFHTSNHAFRAEKLLKAQAMACKLVPVPRHLSSECGVCLRLETARQDAAVELLKQSKVEVSGVHAL